MATENSIIFCQKNLFSSTFIAFYDMKETGVLSDVTIRIQNRVFSAHRVILAAVIPYFRTMFTSNLAESKENEISMKGLDSDALENIINFAYTNQIKITTENVQSLLIASEFLQLIEMRDMCCGFLSKRLDPNNVIHIRSLADSLNCSSLVENSDCYIRQNFDDFCVTKDFMNLPFPFLNELIRRDDLHVTSEENVFEAIMSWVKIDPKRHIALPDLLTGIRLTQLTPQFLIKKASKEELILESSSCRNLLDEAKHFHILPKECSACCNFSLKKRYYNSHDGMYLFCCSKSTGLIIQKYFPTTEKCITLLNDKTRDDVQRVFALGDEIYVLRRNHFEMFNPVTLEWVPRADFPDTSYKHKYAVPCGNMIYWFENGLTSYWSFFFDAKKNQWISYRVEKLEKFSDAQFVSSQKYIYILGMYHDIENSFGSVRNNNEIYDPSTGLVANIPQMSNPGRIGFGSAVLDDKVYVCGGLNIRYNNTSDFGQSETLLSSAEVYVVSDRLWRPITSMKTERKNFSLVSYDEKLYAFGGKGRTGTNINTIECYDPVTDTWSPVGSFIGEYSFVEAVVIS